MLSSIFVKIKVEKNDEFIIMLLMKDVNIKIKRIGNNKKRIIVKYSNGNSFSFVVYKEVKRE